VKVFEVKDTPSPLLFIIKNVKIAVANAVIEMRTISII
jgi:hypothetical protein